jgi:PAS domain S-box-containing protein
MRASETLAQRAASLAGTPAARPLWLRFAIAAAVVLAAWLARTAIDPWLGDSAVPFITFFPAVAGIAWYCGLAPAVLAVVAGACIGEWCFMAPRHTTTIHDPVAFVVFPIAASLIVAAIELMHRARAELSTTRDVLSTTLTSIGDGVIVTDAAARITFLNTEAERLTGWTRREAEGHAMADVFRIVHEQTREPVADPVAKVLRDRTASGIATHTVLIARDGTETPIDDSAAPVRRPGQPIQGAVLVFRDVREQRVADAAQARLAAIVESSGDAILSKDLEGRILTWNAGAQRMFGYAPEEIIGRSVLVLVPAEHRMEEEAVLQEIRAGRPTELIETTRVTKHGRPLQVSVRVSPLRDAAGRVAGASKIVRDLSDLAAARDSLAREKEMLATTLASIGDAVISTDTDGRIAFMNPIAQELTGWPASEAAGRPLDEVFRIVHQTTREVVENPAQRAMREGVIVGLANHAILIARNGTERPIDDSAAPIRNRRGRVVGSVLVFRDITQRKRDEAALREGEARFRVALEGTPVVVFNCDRELRYTWIYNAQPPVVHPAGLLGKRDDEILPPESVQELMEMKARVLATMTGERRVIALRQGEKTSYFDCAIEPMLDHAGGIAGVRGAMSDITRRRRTEIERERLRAELAAKVQELQTILDIAPVQIWFADAECKTLTGNRRAYEEHGLEYGINASFEAPVRELPRHFRVEVDGRELAPSEMPMQIAACTGRPIQRFEHDVVDGFGRRKTMWANVAPLFDDSGKVRGVIGAYIDVTTMRAAEQALREADQRKNEFLATLAHELRNPLAPIRNSITLLQMEGSSEPKLVAAREVIERQVQHLSRLLDDLLDVNRLARHKLELRRERVTLSSVVARAMETAGPGIEAGGHHASVEVRDDPVLDADPMRLAQVFSNLLNNAAKYMDPGGRIWLTAERRGDEVVVSVKDTGIGIPPGSLPRLFEMFAQVPLAYERAQGGIGIGLSLAKDLVELHGGTITAHSEGRGTGCEFVVQLPIAPDQSPETPRVQNAHHPAPGGVARRILIADDVRDNADTLAMMLRALGHEVHVAYDGAEALALAEKANAEVALLDIGMPHVDGYEACRRMREHPWGKRMYLIAQTGWGQEEDRRRAEEAGFDRHMLKPIDCAALMNVLATLPRS